MKSKKFTVLFVVATILLFTALFVMKGTAGNLEPNAPPGSTMVTLGQLSSQIAAISSPVEKVIRGVITLDANDVAVESIQNLSSTIDPNRSVVMLSDAIASDHSGTATSWMARNGACLVALTPTAITVRAEGLHATTQKVSYQIIVYK
jgi:hypothetical protein